MNDTQREQVTRLRHDGFGYGHIAKALGLSENTIKTYCRRNGLGGVSKKAGNAEESGHFCQNCGISVMQARGRKEKRFCSDGCRAKWWNSHLDRVNRKAVYQFECLHCHRSFTAYGDRNRKFCCHKCYVNYRFGGDKR